MTHGWEDYTGTVTTHDQVDYTYDYAGNRLTRDIPSSLYPTDDRDESYTYDGLHRLIEADAGTGAVDKLRHEWGLDQLGNWTTVRRDGTLDYTTPADGDFIDSTDIARNATHNDVNEITAIDGLYGNGVVDPIHDLAGNMTAIPQPLAPSSSYTLKYDAWNRMVKVTNASSVSIQENEYDGLNRRIVKIDTNATASTGDDVAYDYYYNQQWQVLEIHEGGDTTNPEKQYVYHPQYVDAIALRDYDSDTNGTSVRHYYLQDANFNVTAVTDNAGTVVERYSYTPYGEVTVLDLNFLPVTPNESTIDNEYLYTGRRRDPETHLQLNRNRFYHAPLGRWLNRDHVGQMPRIGDRTVSIAPASGVLTRKDSADRHANYDDGLNLYQYIQGNPLSELDPSGLHRHHNRNKPCPKPKPPGPGNDGEPDPFPCDPQGPGRDGLDWWGTYPPDVVYCAMGGGIMVCVSTCDGISSGYYTIENADNLCCRLMCVFTCDNFRNALGN